MTTGPWDADIEKILTQRGYEHPGFVVLALMAEAWQYGYTTGMSDASKLEELVAREGGGHLISVQGPLPYPGGKDGMFLARCSCGEYVSAIGPENEVRKAGAEHVHAKRRSRR